MGEHVAGSDDEESVNSVDALCEMLGITSMDAIPREEEKDSSDDYPGLPSKSRSVEELLRVEDHFIADAVAKHKLKEEYVENSVCIFPEELSIPAEIMRRITEELVWGGDTVKADRSYENIMIWKDGVVYERPTLTRLENLNDHACWNQLCNNYIRRCISAVMGRDMVLYKSKLNLKPAGGSGFAPHSDAPSLVIALGDAGPQTFVTVMVAIDCMNAKNGCLRIAKGRWSEDNACPTVAPEAGASPDAGGRAGAIPLDVAETMDFAEICCDGGQIVAFNAWAPHRSGANQSNFARRAVFLTYNPASEGDFHNKYYERMAQLRSDWRSLVGLTPRQPTTMSPIDKLELDALATIPRI